MFRPDVPVDADDVVATQLLRVARELIVVIPLRDRIAHQRRVRQGEQIHDLPAHRVDHVLRNDVARKAAGATGVDVAGETAEWIADEPQRRPALLNVREKSPLRSSADGMVLLTQEGIGPRQEVQRVEEQPVALPVEPRTGIEYRSPQRERRVVIAVARLLAQRRRPPVASHVRRGAQSFVLSPSCRLKYAADPLNRELPLLVTTMMLAPPARPYSAW